MTTPERPSFVAHWSEIERPDDSRYSEDDELMSACHCRADDIMCANQVASR